MDYDHYHNGLDVASTIFNAVYYVKHIHCCLVTSYGIVGLYCHHIGMRYQAVT